jgi:hypothetical protein
LTQVDAQSGPDLQAETSQIHYRWIRHLEDEINRRAAAIARLDDKGTAHVRSVLKYSIYLVVISGILFAASIYGINNARTNAGEGVAWFASAITGLGFVSALISAAGVVRELRKRRSIEKQIKSVF